MFIRTIATGVVAAAAPSAAGPAAGRYQTHRDQRPACTGLGRQLGGTDITNATCTVTTSVDGPETGRAVEVRSTGETSSNNPSTAEQRRNRC